MTRILIADDEAPARRKLARFLSEHDDVEIVAEAASGVVPTIPAGEFTAKKTPGCSEQAATKAMIATKLSSSIEPYPTCHAFHSRAISLGVVPEEISA